jgi:hypothetical protein
MEEADSKLIAVCFIAALCQATSGPLAMEYAILSTEMSGDIQQNSSLNIPEAEYAYPSQRERTFQHN